MTDDPMLDEFKDRLNSAIAQRVRETGRHLTVADKRELIGRALRQHASACPAQNGGACRCGASEFEGLPQ
jgi:hypothetical protein